MMKEKHYIAIIASTDRALDLARRIKAGLDGVAIYSTRAGVHSTDGPADDIVHIDSIAVLLSRKFQVYGAFVFIGALGICVRSITPYIRDKETDPAIVNLDDHGYFVQSVLSGHAGGANQLTRTIAGLLGAQAVITTSSDLQQLWNLDTLGRQYGWKTKATAPMNTIISSFVNNRPTALLLDIKDKGTEALACTRPDFVDVYYDLAAIPLHRYQLLIAVTYRVYTASIPVLYYHPPVLNIGMGCSRDIEPDLLETSVKEQLDTRGLALDAVRAIASIDIKGDETAFLFLSRKYGVPLLTYTKEELNAQTVANPSDVVLSKLGVVSVSEASAQLASGNPVCLLEKQKLTLSSGKKHTIAIALQANVIRKGSIAIVGAGPGDAALISVRGKQLLETADLILYAGSLVPEQLTHYAKQGARVQNSAGLTLEQQMVLMEAHYAQGHLIVRLQSGDPSIYGAIQEQMTLFDEKGMDYFIVPGISSFQAAAAVLRSEFTIPEVVQTIILTRGEGNTPLPQREKLQEMAAHQATMCIFLSATIARHVQEQLLEHYPPETPTAILYRVTWEDEKIVTGRLDELAQLIRANKLTRTVLIIVGVAIGARENRSHLYNPQWRHIFRTGK
jgi:precorrin-4 C11-methyltransferase